MWYDAPLSANQTSLSIAAFASAILARAKNSPSSASALSLSDCPLFFFLSIGFDSAFVPVSFQQFSFLCPIFSQW